MHAKSLQSCPTPCDPVDRSPPGSSVHGFSRQEYRSGLPVPFPLVGMGGCNIWAHKSALENICLKTCPARFSLGTECLISALRPELLSGGVENQQLQQHMI